LEGCVAVGWLLVVLLLRNDGAQGEEPVFERQLAGYWPLAQIFGARTSADWRQPTQVNEIAVDKKLGWMVNYCSSKMAVD
jgi:hypothetical protein